VIALFASALLENRAPVIYGNGEQTRDFTYVANVVDGVLRACHAPGAAGQIINVATGGRVSLNDLLRMMNRSVGTTLQPIYRASRPGDVRDSQAEIEKAKRLLGYSPIVSCDEGLQRTLGWYRAQSNVAVTVMAAASRSARALDVAKA
jgi:nucleoside-diphosphate-sugar epimerase